ncbi:gamma-glutamyl-gamma-aminobutyrate hydrolase family protein [Oscillibacter hominis]|uniref:Gamma-glutamyl-gamma-aminobutyrate hydrolase family protein n=1 Tax=Oscillibacter hominis TaxID=2763056 RepID=A0A7G9B7F9_9FIRM|nr:gamma-glutamyl-gamma-aminobutyrate hydrolase family protein [Oscillibacter hominis]QNL45490.1 gamma-glutamyl-gamma-aminobutyrate hydrolase family protein [Oscillibacter hominis]
MKRILIAGPQPDDAFGSVRAVSDAVLRFLPGVERLISLNPEELDSCDGMILPGGVPDVDPALYAEENQGSRGVNPALDQAQLRMLDRAVELAIPVLGICRGYQLMNVHFGGSLVQDGKTNGIHRGGARGEDLHGAYSLPGTWLERLYGPKTVVNTLHHQSIKRLAPEFALCQVWFDDAVSPERRRFLCAELSRGSEEDYTEECTVEGICHRSLPLIGVQWHPELLSPDGKGTAEPEKLFLYFAGLK